MFSINVGIIMPITWMRVLYRPGPRIDCCCAVKSHALSHNAPSAPPISNPRYVGQAEGQYGYRR